MARKINKKAVERRSGERRPPAVPVFSLYGETAPVADAEFVHIEDIRARSERYDWHIKPHQHRGLLQMLVLLRGDVEVEADARITKVKAPCALSVPPAVVHSFRFKPGTHGYILTVSEALVAQAEHRGLIEDLFVEPRVISFTDAPARARPIAALLEQIHTELNDSAPGRAQMQEWLVGAVLLLIARHRASVAEANRGGSRQRALGQFRALIEAHFLEHWPIARYAEAMRMTEGRLNRLTRAVAGKSAFDLVQDRLLLEARRRLIYVAAPIALLAYELGFEDPAYFSRYFKTRVGMTPSAFRRSGSEARATSRPRG